MPAPVSNPLALAGGGLDGDARTGEEGVDARPAGSLVDAAPGTGPECASCGPGGVPAGPPGGMNSPDHLGFLGSGSVACTSAGSPVPRLMVSLIEGVGSMPIGCPREAVLGNDGRDCAHPASARPSIPAAIFRLMTVTLSILGEFAPRDPEKRRRRTGKTGHAGRS